MKFRYLKEFEKEVKKLSKKIPSLEGDLENFKKFVVGVEFGNNKGFVLLIEDLNRGLKIMKTRLMVRSLKGKSMTRVVFAFCLRDDLIEFIEIYLKNNKNRENSDRIKKYLDDL